MKKEDQRDNNETRRLEEEDASSWRTSLSHALPKRAPLFETARVARAPFIGIVATMARVVVVVVVVV